MGTPRVFRHVLTMPTIHYILKDGSTRSVEAKPGASVMETAIHHNIRGIDAECPISRQPG